MARRNVTATFDVSGTNTVVTLDTGAVGNVQPFTFDGTNSTTVTDSGLLNADFAGTGTEGRFKSVMTAEINTIGNEILIG